MIMFTPAIILAVLAAYIVKGMCGFANTLVFGALVILGSIPGAIVLRLGGARLIKIIFGSVPGQQLSDFIRPLSCLE